MLWQKITAPNALMRAFEKVQQNGGIAGGDGVSITSYQRGLKNNIRRLCDALRSGAYLRGECRQILIPKSGNRVRRLMVPTVEDRIIHTSIAQHLGPELEPHFERHSYGYRPGRSVKQALEEINRLRKLGYTHVWEADIKGYFDAVHHGTLVKALASVIKRESNQQLFDFIQDDLTHQANELGFDGCGLVQGSPLSPLLANLYLDVLDEKLSGQGSRIIRYADDFVILCKTAECTEAAYEKMKTVLSSLSLQLNPRKTNLVTFEDGFTFLGHTFEGKNFPEKLQKPKRTIAQSKSEEPTQINHVTEKQSGDDVESADLPKPRKDYARGDHVLYVFEDTRRVVADEQVVTVLTPQNNEVVSLPTHTVDRIVVGPKALVDHSALSHFAAMGKEISLVDGFGANKTRLVNNDQYRNRLQFKQALMFGTAQTAAQIAVKLVEARIRNQRTQLFRLNRNPRSEFVDDALVDMRRTLKKLNDAGSVETARGLEGASGRRYWPALASLSSGAGEKFTRSRPARDPLNAAINYLTAMLERDVRSAVSRSGLHSGFGALHVPQDRADALVFDLMEPFRAPLTEGLPVFLFNARRLKLSMFWQNENGLTRINSKGQKAIIKGYETSIARRVKEEGGNKSFSWRIMMQRNAANLAQCILRDRPHAFKPFIMEA